MKSYLAIAFSGALASAGTAATIVQSGNFSYVPDGSQTLNFNQFDSNLGTLIGITITTNLVKSGGSLFVDNDALTPASGVVSQTVRIDLTSANTLLDSSFQTIGDNIAASSFYSASVTADDGDGAGYQAGGTDNDGTFFSNVNASDTGNVHSLFFSQYTGNGTYSITVTGIQSISTSAVSGASGSFDPALASGDVTVTYTYSPVVPVPEPSASLLGGIGVLCLLRRRR